MLITNYLQSPRTPALAGVFFRSIMSPLAHVMFASLLAAFFSPFSALAGILLLLALPRFPDWKTPLGAGIAFWLIWPPLTLTWSQSPGLALSHVAVLLCLPLGVVAGLELSRRGHTHVYLNAILPALLLILLGWGLIQGPNTFTGKPEGPFQDPNTYAAVINLLMLPILGRWLASNLASMPYWQRIGIPALIAASLFLAFLAASRGATLAALIMLPLLLWSARIHPAFHRKLLTLSVLALSTYFAAYLAGSGASVGQRVLNTIATGDPSRIMLIKSAWLMIQDHPWLGTGLGSFRLRYPAYRFEAETAGGWVHNDYLQFWLEGGLPLLGALLFIAGLVAWHLFRTLRNQGPESTIRMGYLVAIASILIQAHVNFLLYYSLVALVIGLYLAFLLEHTHHASSIRNATNPIRLASIGYAFIVGWLLLGQIAVELLLWQARPIQRAASHFNLIYPKYSVAYWTSVAAPLHPSPQQMMGTELAHASIINGGGLIIDAMARMDQAWRLAPCYIPFGNDALFILANSKPDEHQRSQGKAIAVRNLTCNARHGLSYYFAGHFSRTPEEQRIWWRAGLAASTQVTEKLLFAALFLANTQPEHKKEINLMVDAMALAIRSLENKSGVKPDLLFWTDMQIRLHQLGGARLPLLVPETR